MKRYLTLSAGTLEYEFTRKAVKNLNLRVKNGRVYVSAPARVPLDTVERFLWEREAFIRRALARQEKPCPRLFSEPFFQNGDTVCLWGKEYCLRCEVGKPSAKLTDTELILSFFDEKGRKRALSLLADSLLPPVMALFDKVFDDFCAFCATAPASWGVADAAFVKNGYPMPSVRLRSMCSRWGSCSPQKNSITFSTMLLERDPTLAEGVMAHELVHLLAPDHSPRFHALLDRFCPDNALLRKRLNKS